MSRVLDAQVEKVWQAWSDPEYVTRWWGPKHFTSPSAEIDFREGGRSLVCMRAPADFGGQDMYNTWSYTKIIPLREIDYLLEFADKTGAVVDPVDLGLPPDMPKATRNRVIFKDLGAGRTELTITEFDWPAGQMMDMSRMGLEQCLDKMADIFAR